MPGAVRAEREREDEKREGKKKERREKRGRPQHRGAIPARFLSSPLRLSHDLGVSLSLVRLSAQASLVLAVATFSTLALAQGPTDAPSRDPQQDDRADARARESSPRRQRASGARLSRRERRAIERDAQRYWDPVSDRGQAATGLYLGASFVNMHGAEGVVRVLRETNATAAVLDLKDSDGRVHHDTAIPELRDGRTGWLGDTAALIRELHANDVYVIARITCFADRRLPTISPERAIQHIRRPRPWTSWGTGGTWLDPYNPQNHAMVIGLAREAQALGFDEVQLDYVRFPVDDGTQYARYPSQSDEPRPQVLMGMLREMDEQLTIPIGVDVFGLAAYRRGDPSGLGQDLEAWTRHVEIFSPMLYINAMREWRVGEPNRAFALVHDGTAALRERIGARPIIRPYLQSFPRGAGQAYDATFITQQVRGVRHANADGFLWWHPGFDYGMVQRAMANGSRRLVPFPIPERVRITRLPPAMLPSWISRRRA
jgi:hypothetical protein